MFWIKFWMIIFFSYILKQIWWNPLYCSLSTNNPPPPYFWFWPCRVRKEVRLEPPLGLELEKIENIPPLIKKKKKNSGGGGICASFQHGIVPQIAFMAAVMLVPSTQTL